MKIFRLETPRLLIREWNIQDAAMYFPLSQDPALNGHPHGKISHTSLEDAEKKIIEWALLFGQTKMGILPIFLNEEKIQVGVCGIKPLMLGPGNLHFEVICRIGSQYSGHGFASEAIPAILNYGFKTLGLKELVGISQANFPAGPRVLQKVGMSFLKSVTLQNKKVDLFSVNPQ